MEPAVLLWDSDISASPPSLCLFVSLNKPYLITHHAELVCTSTSPWQQQRSPKPHSPRISVAHGRKMVSLEPHTGLRRLARSTEPQPLPPAEPALCLSRGVCRPVTSLILSPTAVTLAGLQAPRSWGAVREESKEDAGLSFLLDVHIDGASTLLLFATPALTLEDR